MKRAAGLFISAIVVGAFLVGCGKEEDAELAKAAPPPGSNAAAEPLKTDKNMPGPNGMAGGPGENKPGATAIK